MLVEKVGHEADGTLCKSSCSEDYRAKLRLFLAGFADFCINFEPFGVFRMLDCLYSKAGAQFYPSSLQGKDSGFLTGRGVGLILLSIDDMEC